MPALWSTATLTDLRGLRGVCLDIDETLSTNGKLTAPAFEALWLLKNAGYLVIPITGRPAGWCDHFARFWPVDAVVGENGAFTFYMQNGVRKRIDTPSGKKKPEMMKKKLEALGKKIKKRFPLAVWASDQAYREFDLAIDICEDVKPWSQSDVKALLKMCWDAGAHAKLSSIHVNTWFGEYDKRSGLEHWLNSGAPGLSGTVPQWNELLFIGDSPNDEPMFASFQHSVGVANLAKYLGQLKHAPRWITDSESGAGFREMADKLVKVKKLG